MFHINGDGEAKPCRARKNNCKFAKAAPHFNSIGEAENYIRLQHDNSNFASVSRTNSSASSRVDSAYINSTAKFYNDGEVVPIELSNNALLVCSALRDSGCQPIIVGGYVRDIMLGYDSKDVDIEVFGSTNSGDSLSLNDLVKSLKSIRGVRVSEVGVSFAVVKVSLGGEEFDVSLPRTENSTGLKHFEYNVQHDSRMSFGEASSRRDFTFNSMGVDPFSRKLVDPNGGSKDLQNKVLRHASNAFADDPLRCLRAVNFASRFDLRFAPETAELCQSMADSFSSLSGERVEEEFNKFFIRGKYCDAGLAVLYDSGWSKSIPQFSQFTRDELVDFGETLNKVPASERKYALVQLLDDGNCHNRTRNDTVVTDNDKNSVTNTNSDNTENVRKKKCKLDSESSSSAKLFSSAVRERQGIQDRKLLYSAKSRGEIVALHRSIKNREPSVSNQNLEACYRSLGNYRIAGELSKLSEMPIDAVISGKKLLDRGFAPGVELGRIISRAQKIQDEEGVLDFDVLLARGLKE